MTHLAAARWTEAYAKVHAGQRVNWRAGDRTIEGRIVLADTRTAEGAVPGSFDAIRQAVRKAICDRIEELAGVEPYVWVCDLGADWAVYEVGDDLYMVTYSFDAAGAATLGDPVQVFPVTTYQPKTEGTPPAAAADGGVAELDATEAVYDDLQPRVLEAAGAAADGGRIFHVLMIRYGDSKNGRRYTEAVMRAAAPLYEGAKAYDHHRTETELATSTITGLVGTFRNVTATTEGLEADLYLLPSATHVAEALDMALANQASGLAPLVGLSQDVIATWRPVTENGRTIREATSIVQVNSVDVVAHPAAGGMATRMVASSNPGDPADTTTPTLPKETPTVNLKQLLALLRGVESAQRPTLLTEHAAVLQAAGITADEALQMAEATAPAASATEATFAATSFMGRAIVAAAVESANLQPAMVDVILADLGDQFTEADVTHRITSAARLLENVEKIGLAPQVQATAAAVTTDEVDAKRARLDAMFAGNFREGYRSLKQAYFDIQASLGRPNQADPFSETVNRAILRESALVTIDGVREPFDSARSTESLATTSWAEILGDSITRRMVAEYSVPSLQTWRNVVSGIVPLQDFRTQRITRMGGYGVLPAVSQGATYNPLTSPTDEEATYAITKRGGTEDLTLEAITNDDLRAVLRIPQRLGRSAAQTLFRFVWDFFNTNPTIYDATALFAAGHANTDTNALSGANLSVGRRKMRKQAAYGDSSEVLGLTPKYLAVCSDLEELAYELCTSAVALPTGAPVGAATNIPNIHQGLTPIVVDYWSSSTTWFAIADPADVPTIELGFLGGQEDPALFVQNDNANGSMFNADKVTWKIRHIYGGAVIDYRGLYRGNV